MLMDAQRIGLNRLTTGSQWRKRRMYRPLTRRPGLLLLPVLLILCGCSLKEAVDERYAPVDPLRAQLAATEAATKQLALLDKPNAYVALATKDLLERLPKALAVPLKTSKPDSKDADRKSVV